MLIFMIIGTRKGTERSVGNRLLKFKEVNNAHITEGKWNMIIRLEVRDVDDLHNFIYKKMRPIKNILRTETFIAAQEKI